MPHRSTTALLLALIGCGGNTDDLVAATDTAPEADADSMSSCVYANPFSGSEECKEYSGDGWSPESMEADCAAPVMGGDPGELSVGEACARDQIIGECLVNGGESLENTIVFPGSDASGCSGAELGCSFALGDWLPGDLCLGGDDDGGVATEDAFVPFAQVCFDPLEDEPQGLGPEGQVCTWEAISGATEEGRRFVDYASCEPVLTQRPYWPNPAEVPDWSEDPRLEDAAYMAELDWLTAQVEASSCVCCHTDAEAPSGPSGWYIDSGALWIDQLDDDGLAMMAGWVDSTAFGRFPAEDNNGFSREETGMLSTDPARARAFLEAELARRDLTEEDFVESAPFGGILYDQLFYEPSACENGEGIDLDGVLTWSGGAARYLYILDEGSMSPGVPPNLDTPEGTRWRLDVDYTADPLPSGFRLGEIPDGTSQQVPSQDETPTLESGVTYYLVALSDIYQPATRCLFTAP